MIYANKLRNKNRINCVKKHSYIINSNSISKRGWSLFGLTLHQSTYADGKNLAFDRKWNLKASGRLPRRATQPPQVWARLVLPLWFSREEDKIKKKKKSSGLETMLAVCGEDRHDSIGPAPFLLAVHCLSADKKCVCVWCNTAPPLAEHTHTMPTADGRHCVGI